MLEATITVRGHLGYFAEGLLGTVGFTPRIAVSTRLCCACAGTLGETAKGEVKTVKPLDYETCRAGSPAAGSVYGCGEGGFFSRPFRASFFRAAMRLPTSAFCSGVNNS